jgi:hypothetical protein
LEALNFELVQSLRSIKEKSGKLFIKNIPPHLLVMMLYFTLRFFQAACHYRPPNPIKTVKN